MATFAADYNTTEQLDQELNFVQLQDINAGAASLSYVNVDFSGSVAHALELYLSSGKHAQLSWAVA